MRSMQTVLDGWAEQPLLRRKTGKTYSPDEFEEEHAQQLAARYVEIAEGGREIHKLLLASNRVLKVSKGAPIWRFYVEFINDMVIDGLARTVANSLRHLHDNVDPATMAANEGSPLLEIQLELIAPDLIYQYATRPNPCAALRRIAASCRECRYRPQLSDAEASSMARSVSARVEGWMKGFFHICKLVKRLDRTDGDFLKEVAETEQVIHGIGTTRSAA